MTSPEQGATDLMILITTAQSVPIASGLAAACGRAGIKWSCFFTNDGIKALADEHFVAILETATQVVACEHSWSHFMDDLDCPAELGSQTINSAMMATAARLVSL